MLDLGNIISTVRSTLHISSEIKKIIFHKSKSISNIKSLRILNYVTI